MEGFEARCKRPPGLDPGTIISLDSGSKAGKTHC